MTNEDVYLEVIKQLKKSVKEYSDVIAEQNKEIINLKYELYMMNVDKIMEEYKSESKNTYPWHHSSF